MAEANPSNLSDEDPTKMCDHCSYRGINTHAGTYCQVCSEHLCDTCEVVHRSSKGSRDHELKPFEKSQRLSIKQKALISSIMTCDIHRTEMLTIFCVDHDIVVCNVCNTMKHRKCNTEALKQTSKDANKKNDVIRCTEKIKTLLSESKEIVLSRTEDKKIIENCSKQCIQEVIQFKQQIIAFAERLAQDMTDKISNAKNQFLCGFEKDIRAVVEMKKQMEHLASSFETLGQDTEISQFVLMMKEKRNTEDWREMKDDLLKQGKRVTLEFKQSDQLVTLLSEITSMGILEVKEKQNSHYDTVNELPFNAIISTPTNKKVIDARTNNVTGCVFMPDGALVICDVDKSVKVFTPDFKLKNELTIESHVWDIAVVSKNEVIGTQLNLSSLQFLTVSDRIEKGKCIPVGMRCWGIDCKHERLYVSCDENYGQGGVVKVLTMDGVTVNTFTVSQGNPSYLAVNSSGDRILVSTHSNGILTVNSFGERTLVLTSHYGNTVVVCIDNTGKTLYTYTHSLLGVSGGLLVDSYDNVMVCGKYPYNIHVVNGDGTKHRIILTEEDGLNLPYCLAYRPSDNTLIVGQCGSSSLMAFTIK